MKFHRHKHTWVERERFYTTPIGGKWDNVQDSNTFLKATLGVTTILYSCECTAMHKIEILGKKY